MTLCKLNNNETIIVPKSFEIIDNNKLTDTVVITHDNCCFQNDVKTRIFIYYCVTVLIVLVGHVDTVFVAVRFQRNILRSFKLLQLTNELTNNEMDIRLK